MAGSLPTVRNGLGVGLYPVIRRVVCGTLIASGVNGTEQRARTHAPFNNFTLPFNNMLASERDAHRTFVNSQKGQFDSTWDATLAGTLYSHLTFEDDEFMFRETEPMLYSYELRFRQTQNRGAAIPSVGATFPTLANGLVAQRPYSQARRFNTLKNDRLTGPRYAYALFGGGLTNFPTGALLGWELTYPALSDADLSTVETYFRGMSGRYGTFSFPDPDSGSTATNCRFGSDVMEIKHYDFGVSSTVLQIVQTNG